MRLFGRASCRGSARRHRALGHRADDLPEPRDEGEPGLEHLGHAVELEAAVQVEEAGAVEEEEGSVVLGPDTTRRIIGSVALSRSMVMSEPAASLVPLSASAD